jgi:ATP-dependent RNA helicase DeaD
METFVAGEMKQMEIRNFKDLPLSPQVMKSIEELGFTELFPIQAEAILPLLEGKDLIGQAQTGTGKTAAFGVPMVERANPEERAVQGLVLLPTRELAMQVAEQIGLFGKYRGIKVLAVYGGEPVQKQVHALARGVQIIVGTPGRVIDLLERRSLNFSHVSVLVLDEADRMLDMGFIEDIEYILSRVPRQRQTSLFSATIDQSVLNVCHRYLKNPEKKIVSKDEIAVTQINQYYMVVNPYSKFERLRGILDENNIKRAIIFCRKRTETSMIAEKLRRNGYDAKALHAGFTQPQRDQVINAFRNGRLKFLVATDVAARGLDIDGITHIINYDMPEDAVVYFHRIGRTGRMGHEGTAISLVGYGEIAELDEIKALTKTNIEEIEQNLIVTPHL